MKMHNHIIIWVSAFVISLVVNTAQADRVKDLTNVGGVRGNQLVDTAWSWVSQALVMARTRPSQGRV